MKNKRILITGMGGSIGSELCNQLAPENKIFGLDINETELFDLIEEKKQEGLWVHGRVGDVRDLRVVEDVFSDFKPQVVFHAAARKHVTPMQWNPREAKEVNIDGTLNMVETAKRWECVEKFVFISTDKAVQASNVMGASKRFCEVLVRNEGKGFVVVRFGNVLGSRGSVIPLWEKAINEGKNIKVTDREMERYMMSLSEAVDLVIQAAKIGKGGEIICLDMGKKVKILQLAERIVKEAQVDSKIEIIGIRSGEQLSEKLMFEEEERVAVKEGRFLIIK